jgi:transcriptional repressor NrdR
VDCPDCDTPTRVIETRRAGDGAAVRRRRACPRCGQRFTTFERFERPPLSVRKRNWRLEPFDRVKLLGGLLRAAHKRPVERRRVEALADRIEREAERAGGELAARRVGDMALAGLRDLDRVAYLQFAAVYKGFSDPSQFSSELARLESSGEPARADYVRSARKDARSPANLADRRGIDG